MHDNLASFIGQPPRPRTDCQCHTRDIGLEVWLGDVVNPHMPVHLGPLRPVTTRDVSVVGLGLSCWGIPERLKHGPLKVAEEYR
jgi:hypothetical protein